ncbi:MAG TPA: hypothetical protein VMB78_04500, partial [Dissulfurispiraceae bacterium]|nr:hypothetical protein [Dissulfurispiraceae bacterium]
KYNPAGSSRYVNNRSRVIYEIMVRRGIVVEEFEDVMKNSEENAEAPVTRSPVNAVTAPAK